MSRRSSPETVIMSILSREFIRIEQPCEHDGWLVIVTKADDVAEMIGDWVTGKGKLASFLHSINVV